MDEMKKGMFSRASERYAESLRLSISTVAGCQLRNDSPTIPSQDSLSFQLQRAVFLSAGTTADDVLANRGRRRARAPWSSSARRGDLTMRKLIPSLFNLAKAALLPKDFVWSERRTTISARSSFVRRSPSSSPPAIARRYVNWFSQRLRYHRGSFSEPGNFTSLAERLKQLESEFRTGGNCLFYLATAPRFFATVVQQLGAAGLAAEEEGKCAGW